MTTTRRPQQVLALSAALLGLAGLLTATGLGGDFGGLGLSDVVRAPIAVPRPRVEAC